MVNNKIENTNKNIKNAESLGAVDIYISRACAKNKIEYKYNIYVNQAKEVSL